METANADMIIQCQDGIELHFSKSLLLEDSYFANLFAPDYKHQSLFTSEIMNTILTMIIKNNKNKQEYIEPIYDTLTVHNATALYEVINYYALEDLLSVITKFIVYNIEDIKFDRHFIELLSLYQEPAIISSFSSIKNIYKIKIDLDINIQLFLCLTNNIEQMNDKLYVYLLMTWVRSYKDVNDSIIKVVLNEHLNKIISLEHAMFNNLHDFLKAGSYIESFNFFKLNTFDRVIKSENRLYNKTYDLEEMINKHNIKHPHLKLN
jgi:hypothetical protein